MTAWTHPEPNIQFTERPGVPPPTFSYSTRRKPKVNPRPRVEPAPLPRPPRRGRCTDD